jgi:beta-galactosidase
MPITGCAYYPEHWDEARWSQDAATMREAGLSVVRLAEFAWDKLEPQAGTYDFGWLDRAIDTLAAEGLQIVMCTPTPTPPPWLTHLHPEICRVRQDGIRISPGGRRHACANVPAYQDYSRTIVEKVTEHFGQHPAVIGWQIDNEFGCGETTRCHCDHCRARFHEWLQEKYGTLDELNSWWGTQFWGMTYHDWSHIPIPGLTTEPQNPSMRLDYRRFSSDSWVEFQRMQIEIVRENSPERWITHNFMVRHWSLDYWKLAEDLDFVSYDNYPHALKNPAETAMNLDLMYSFKKRPFWIMEQQPGPVNWHKYNPPVPNGQVRLWSHQAIAHGANAIVYFRYRASRTGQEQYHRGLLKWDGSKDQCFFEAQQVSEDIQNLPELSRPQATVGILFDYHDLWAIELEPVNSLFSYWWLVYDIYQTYWDARISVDFLRRGEILDGYNTVIVPAAILRSQDEIEQWREWVEQGGQLIITFRSFVREPSNIATEEPLPGGLTNLVGAHVLDYSSVPPTDYEDWYNHRVGMQIRAVGESQPVYNYKIWAENLEPTTAEPLFYYADGALDGQTAITRNNVGHGEVIYLGCWPSDFGELAQSMGWIPDARQANRQAILHGEDGSTWQVRLNHYEYPVGNLNGFDARYERIDNEV